MRIFLAAQLYASVSSRNRHDAQGISAQSTLASAEAGALGRAFCPRRLSQPKAPASKSGKNIRKDGKTEPRPNAYFP